MRIDLRRAGALALLACALTACEREPEAIAPPPVSAPATAPQDALRAAPAGAVRSFDKREAALGQAASAEPVADASPLRRYLAVRHDLAIFTAADGVEAAWKSAEAACADAGCEVLASSIAHDDDRAPATAALEARLPPAALPAFLARLGSLGSIGRHSTQAEDKTDEVIDTEAKQKNMAEFRDNLRRLLATPGSRLKDLVEVERELTRVQGELDSLATRRKVLANDTDKVRVSVVFATRPAVLEAGMWAPVRYAALRAGHVLAGSVAALIGFVIAVLPWALVLAAVAAGARAALRRARRGHAG